MFFLPFSRFKLIRIYHEDPTGSTFFAIGKRGNLFRFLTLLFYSFIFSHSNAMPFSFTALKKPYWSWVYKNKHKIMQWDALRRYNYKFVRLLRVSFYKKALLEYKKLKYFYFTLRDYQFRKFALKGVPLYTRFKAHFLAFLELRLLTLCVRLGFYDTHIQGRQELSHFGILIDGKRVYHSNYVVKVGSVLFLEPFIGFNNFKFGFDSVSYPHFVNLPKLGSLISNKILATYNLAKEVFTVSRCFSTRPIGFSARTAWSSIVCKYQSLFSSNLLSRMRNNWFKIFEHLAFKSNSFSSKRIFSKQRAFSAKKFFNPIVYDRHYEDRAIDLSILKARNFPTFRDSNLDRSVYSLFFRRSALSSTISRRKEFIRLRRKIFHLLPKPYMLISWALKKVYLASSPRLEDVAFPFLSDPTLAFAFINSK